MTAAIEFEPGSYRDRDARVFRDADGNVCRALSARALREWQAVRQEPFFRQAMSDGRIVRSEPCYDAVPPADDPTERWSGTLRHETIPFISYPFEWSFGMLRDAARLQLDLLAEALAAGFTLKDGTAYNIQWNGTRPVFIDVASFVRHISGQPWAGYRQFCQTCLYPLLVQAYRQVPFQPWLRGCLEGISPRHCVQILGWRNLLRRGVLTHVWLHSGLEAWAGASHAEVTKRLPAAGFDAEMIRRNALNLAKLVGRLQWAPPASGWSDYSDNNSYSNDDSRAKQQFVRAAVRTRRWPRVWDLGANTGTYARIAAENADTVVALDADHAAIERLYQSLKAAGPAGGGASVLPLVVNLADSSPGLGWRGRERLPLVERGLPDLILCLALVHHLVLGAGIPLRDVLEWLADLGGSLVIEFVDRDDPMVTRLLRNRHDNCADYDKPNFERWLFELFEPVARLPLSCGTRELYFVSPRA